MVERIDDESAAVEGARQLGRIEGSEVVYLHEAGGQKDDGVDGSDDPFVSARGDCTLSIVQCRVPEAKGLGEGQIGAVGTGLIPTLGGGTDGTEGDGVPQHDRAIPFMVLLVGQGGALVAGQLVDQVEPLGVTGDEGGATEEIGVLGHAIQLGEGLSIEDGLLAGATLRKRRGSAWMQSGGAACQSDLQRILDDVERDRLATTRKVGLLRLGSADHFLLIVRVGG